MFSPECQQMNDSHRYGHMKHFLHLPMMLLRSLHAKAKMKITFIQYGACEYATEKMNGSWGYLHHQALHTLTASWAFPNTLLTRALITPCTL